MSKSKFENIVKNTESEINRLKGVQNFQEKLLILKNIGGNIGALYYMDSPRNKSPYVLSPEESKQRSLLNTQVMALFEEFMRDPEYAKDHIAQGTSEGISWFEIIGGPQGAYSEQQDSIMHAKLDTPLSTAGQKQALRSTYKIIQDTMSEAYELADGSNLKDSQLEQWNLYAIKTDEGIEFKSKNQFDEVLNVTLNWEQLATLGISNKQTIVDVIKNPVLREKLIEQAYISNVIDPSGSTAVTAIVSPKTDKEASIVVANVGDSLAFFIELDENGQFKDIRPLNNFHDTDNPDEVVRIGQEEGTILKEKGKLVGPANKQISVTRAIGDNYFKGMGHTPEMTEVTVGKGILITSCDGIYQAAVKAKVDPILYIREMVRKIEKEHGPLDARTLPEHLTKQAMKDGSEDNISIVAYRVNPPEQKSVALGVYDGHGGSVVSKRIGENFEQIYQQEAQKVLGSHEEMAEQFVSGFQHQLSMGHDVDWEQHIKRYFRLQETAQEHALIKLSELRQPATNELLKKIHEENNYRTVIDKLDRAYLDLSSLKPKQEAALILELQKWPERFDDIRFHYEKLNEKPYERLRNLFDKASANCFVARYDAIQDKVAGREQVKGIVDDFFRLSEVEQEHVNNILHQPQYKLLLEEIHNKNHARACIKKLDEWLDKPNSIDPKRLKGMVEFLSKLPKVEAMVREHYKDQEKGVVTQVFKELDTLKWKAEKAPQTAKQMKFSIGQSRNALPETTQPNDTPDQTTGHSY